jgi:hypothetical protein
MAIMELIVGQLTMVPVLIVPQEIFVVDFVDTILAT